ncbi:hypothetical protein [Acidithiobacillus ferrianus]|uniref:hypothetical protein n=1 Tax=Acidithiobacillus ferrianus TaxID=2678518 RepID=UPI0034E3D4F7
MKTSNLRRSKEQLPLPRIAVAHESQVPMFQPTRRPVTLSRYVRETPYGTVTITGKLGQGHRDLLDAMLLHSEKVNIRDGRMNALVDPYQIRKAISAGRTMLPYAHIEKLLEDLRTAKVEMTWQDGNRHYRLQEGIITGFVEASSKPVASGTFAQRDANGCDQDHRDMLKITFGQGMTQMLMEDQKIHYPLAPVVGMKHGLSQAIARYCLSHKAVHETFEGICARVGFDLDGKAPRTVRNAKEELRDDAAALATMGIEVRACGSVHRKAGRSKP